MLPTCARGQRPLVRQWSVLQQLTVSILLLGILWNQRADAQSTSEADTVYVKTRNDVSLRVDPGSRLLRIPRGTRVAALGIENGFWKIHLDGQVVLVNNLDIVASPQDRERVEEWAQNVLRATNRQKQAQRDAKARATEASKAELMAARTSLVQDRRWVSVTLANVRSEPDNQSTVLIQMTRDDVVYVQEVRDEWLRVAFSGPFNTIPEPSVYQTSSQYLEEFKFAWIHSSLVSTKDPIERAMDTVEAMAESRRREFVARHPELDEKSRNAILSGSVVLGMVAEAVTASIGKPVEVNRTVGSWGVHEQWVYPRNVYLYFEDGVLTSWQD